LIHGPLDISVSSAFRRLRRRLQNQVARHGRRSVFQYNPIIMNSHTGFSNSIFLYQPTHKTHYPTRPPSARVDILQNVEYHPRRGESRTPCLGARHRHRGYSAFCGLRPIPKLLETMTTCSPLDLYSTICMRTRRQLPYI
jgi:hypothetical protein